MINNKLYGSSSGGNTTNANGTIFEYDYITNHCEKKIDVSLPPLNIPFYGVSALTKANNGLLYGPSFDSNGSIYEYNYLTNSYRLKITMPGDHSPHSPLLNADNGKLYGIDNLSDNIYEYDYITNTYTTKQNLVSSMGGLVYASYSALIEVDNGKLYGMSFYGGTYDAGIIFEYDYVKDTCIKKFDFNGTNGGGPSSQMIKASNGKLYGMADGGVNGLGVIFEYDYVTGLIYQNRFR